MLSEISRHLSKGDRCSEGFSREVVLNGNTFDGINTFSFTTTQTELVSNMMEDIGPTFPFMLCTQDATEKVVPREGTGVKDRDIFLLLLVGRGKRFILCDRQ